MNEPLVISQDPGLLSQVQSSAAAVGIDLQICDGPAQARRLWAGAPLVIVGVDKAAALAGAGLPERSGIHVAGGDADTVLAWSVPLGAPGLVLPRQAGFLASLLDDAQRPAASGVLLRLFGATGGLGTSTLAAGLAVRAARRTRVALVELDPSGGGLDVLMGAEREAGWRWGDLVAARGHVDDLTGHLPHLLGVDVLAASRASAATQPPGVMTAGPEAEISGSSAGRQRAVAPPEAIAAVLASLRRTHDLVVIDQGHVVPGHEEAVLVVGADVRSVLAAQHWLTGGDATIRRAIARAGPGRRLAPDLIADTLGVPVAGVMPHDTSFPAAAEAGDPPGRTGARTVRALDNLLRHLVMRGGTSHPLDEPDAVERAPWWARRRARGGMSAAARLGDGGYR